MQHNHIVYNDPNEKIELSFISPVSKQALEKREGPLTDKQYSKLVYAHVPVGALNVREARVIDFPSSSEFRMAWCDTQPGTQIDIDLDKAKAIQLERLREKRNRS